MCEGIVTAEKEILYLIAFWIVVLWSGGVFA